MTALGKAPAEVDTDRLRLIAPTARDVDEMFERYASDPEVTRYLGWPRHGVVEDTSAFVGLSEAQWTQSGVGPYLIRDLVTGRLLGSTGLALEPSGRAMTGFVLAKDAWGLGYATEALRAMVGVAGNMGVLRLYAICHAGHRASWRVLEKCGFEQDMRWTLPMTFPNLADSTPQEVRFYTRIIERNRPVVRH